MRAPSKFIQIARGQLLIRTPKIFLISTYHFSQRFFKTDELFRQRKFKVNDNFQNVINVGQNELRDIIHLQMNPESLVVEILADKLYFMISDSPPKDIPKAFYFNIDKDLEYEEFFEDFGPLNLAKIWKYTSEVQKIMKDQRFSDCAFYHQTSTDYKKNTNAALLLCCFQMITYGLPAEKVWKPFEKLNLRPFRDASYGTCTYKCTILDCLRGLEYAMKLEWFSFKKFNLSEYEHYEKVENGDINWIIPGKFAAFSSPNKKKKDQFGNVLLTPKDYLSVFKRFGISAVIRLNTKTYDREDFLQNGIKHFDMYFTDGTSPSKEIVQKFLSVTEENEDAFAVHCKAGLGRTGSLIGCYAIKHYGFCAADFIGWIRLCRPGSILGPQQHFMHDVQKELKKAGENSPLYKKVLSKVGTQEVESFMQKLSIKDKKMSKEEQKINQYGDKGQGEKLMAKKYGPTTTKA